MHYLKSALFFLVPLVLFSVQGCGGGSSGAFVPFSGNNQQSQASSNLNIAVAVTPTTIDTTGGQVVATATVTDATTSAPVKGQSVTFSVTPSTQASLAPGMATVTTDSNGKAIAFITPNDTPTTTNVIVMASAKGATAQTTFAIARGTGSVTLPSGLTSEKTIDQNSAGAIFLEQIPFTLKDANGNPRVGVPVTLTVYSHYGSGIIVTDYLTGGTEPGPATVTSDSNGKGIFNVSVTVFAPGVGSNVVDSIIFKAVTNDPVPLVGYGGLVTNLIQTKSASSSALTISPQAAKFLASDVAGATINFGISGGSGGYTVLSSNPNLVSVSLSGTGVVATLVDGSLWAGDVLITVTDSLGATASAAITRQ